MLLTATTPQDFISLMRANYRRRGRKVPLKIWAGHLGYKSHRSLGMLLEGKRLPSPEMVELMAKDFGLTELEKRYFELLVLQRSAKKKELATRAGEELIRLREVANKSVRRLSSAELAQVFEWYVLVIRQLVGTRGFKEEPEWIQKRLRGKVSLEEIRTAIQNLLDIGGLKRNLNTGNLEKTETNIFARDDIPSDFVRKHHRQMLKRTDEAVSEQGVYERELISYIFSCKKSDLPKLKKVLRDFRATLDDQFESADGDSVFQLNLHLFEHTID